MINNKNIAIFFIFSIFFPCYGLKILIVTDFFPHPTRPFVDNQIRGFVDQGHDVHIFAKKDHQISFSTQFDNKKLKIIYKNLPNLDLYDIVYCQLGHLSPQFAQLKKEKKYNWKLIVAFRGYDATAFLKENPDSYKVLFEVADLFLPVCDFFKRILIKSGCNEKKIIVHHSGIDCDFFSFKERSLFDDTIIRIVTVGRLDSLKGYEYSIKAVSQLVKKGIKLRYTIVGSGSCEKKLKSLVKKLNCFECVHIVGQKNSREIADILHNSHLFLLASVTTHGGITEGIPNALMEAMATGLPVISTYHGGIPELVRDGVSGFLVNERDINLLSNKIEYLIHHPEIRFILGICARKHVLKEHNIKLLNVAFKNYLNYLLPSE